MARFNVRSQLHLAVRLEPADRHHPQRHAGAAGAPGADARRWRPTRSRRWRCSCASDAAKDVSGQIFAVRANEIFLMSQSRPIRSVHRAEGWTPRDRGLACHPGDEGGLLSAAPLGRRLQLGSDLMMRQRLRHPVLRRLPAARAPAAQGHRRGQRLVRAGPARPGQGRARDLQLGRGQHHHGRGGRARLPRPASTARTLTQLVLASTTLPFDDRQNAGVVANALQLQSALRSMDQAGSQRAGSTRAGRRAGRRRRSGPDAGGGRGRAQVQGRQHAGDALRRRRRRHAGGPRRAHRATDRLAQRDGGLRAPVPHARPRRTTTPGKSAGCATRAT